jgi:membrane protein YdbS with pleckstrin-like domain
MPYPERLLSEGEEVVVDLRPHTFALVGPILLTAVTIVAAALGASLDLPTAAGWALLGLLAMAVAHLVARYLRWRSTSFVVTSDRLIWRHGVVAKQGREIPLSSLTNLAYRQSIFERVIGAGDLLLESAGRDGEEVFESLPHPATVQGDIYRLLHARRGAPTPGPALSLPEQIEKLADLRQRGVLSEAEFESTKARLLRGP